MCGAMIPAQTKSNDLHDPYLCSLPFLEVLIAHCHACMSCVPAWWLSRGLDLWS
jgi:hypothetical protein